SGEVHYAGSDEDARERTFDFESTGDGSLGPMGTTGQFVENPPAYKPETQQTVTGPGTSQPAPAGPQRIIDTPKLVAAMLKGHSQVSDLLFSPGRAPQIEVNGQLVEMKFKSLECLTPADTKRIAYDLMESNEHPIRKLEQDGSADLSYGLSGVARFRVNVFRQRGSHAVVMRVIPDRIPGFEELKLPKQLEQIVELRNGIVLVTGPTGSGKSSTLAAV